MALPAQAAPAPSENATVNLIRLLVQQGVIKQDQADALVAQAEAEAKSARATGNDRGAAVAQAGDVRVPYIPQTVRDQIRDEVKAEVMTQAKEENWAQPNTFPDWVSRITVEGDGARRVAPVLGQQQQRNHRFRALERQGRTTSIRKAATATRRC